MMPLLHPPTLDNSALGLPSMNLPPLIGVPGNATSVIVPQILGIAEPGEQDSAQDLTLPKKQPADSSSDHGHPEEPAFAPAVPSSSAVCDIEPNESEEEVIDVGRDDEEMGPSPQAIRFKPKHEDEDGPKADLAHFSRCASVVKEGEMCDCSRRYEPCPTEVHALYGLHEKYVLQSKDYVPARIPWIPHCTLMSYKYQGLFRIQIDPNGGATSCHLYMDELVGMSKEEIKDVASEFISLSFAEDKDETAFHVIGVVHGGASYLPDLLDYFADHYGFITVNIGSLSGPDTHTDTLSQYRDKAYKTYSNGTFRFSPLQELSICGVKGEEYGAYFPDFVKRLEASPFMGPVLPWSEMSVVATDNPRDSNDGPIFWIRPGEQTIPLTERSKRRSTNDMPVVRLTEDRQALFEDRTRPHADQIGVDGQGTRDNTAPTAAVGLLKAVICGHPEHSGRATKDVIAFHAGDYDRMQKIFSLDFYEPPLRQCHAWLDTAQLNSLRRYGLRYARLQLHDGDVYYLPRKIVHQFQTISAVASVAWHVRFKKYFEEHGAPNLNTAKGNKGAIYHEKEVVQPYVPPAPTDDEADDGDSEEPEPVEPPPPRRRRPQRPAARRTAVRRKIVRRNIRVAQHIDTDNEDESAVLEADPGPSTSNGHQEADPGPSTSNGPINAGTPGPSPSKRRTKSEQNAANGGNFAVSDVPAGAIKVDGKRRGRKPKMPIIVEDVRLPKEDQFSEPVRRAIKVEKSDDVSSSRDKTEEQRVSKAAKRAAPETPSVQSCESPEKKSKHSDKEQSRSKKSTKDTHHSSGSSSHAKEDGSVNNHHDGNQPSGSSIGTENPHSESIKKGDDIKQEKDVQNGSPAKPERDHEKREKSSHEDSHKRKESRNEGSSSSSHKSRSDRKHGESRSHHKDSDRKHSDEKRSRESGSSRSGHSSRTSVKTEPNEESPRKEKKESSKDSQKGSPEKKQDDKKRRHTDDDELSHKRHRDSNDSHRSSESRKDSKDGRKPDEKKSGHSSDSRKHDSHRHSHGSSSSSSGSRGQSSSHRHKTSTDSRHSDRSSSNLNGSQEDAGNAAQIATQSKPANDVEKPKPDSTTCEDPVLKLAASVSPSKQPVTKPDKPAGPSSAQPQVAKKAVKRKAPPPPSGNVIGEIMAQMDKQRQM